MKHSRNLKIDEKYLKFSKRSWQKITHPRNLKIVEKYLKFSKRRWQKKIKHSRKSKNFKNYWKISQFCWQISKFWKYSIFLNNFEKNVKILLFLFSFLSRFPGLPCSVRRLSSRSPSICPCSPGHWRHALAHTGRSLVHRRLLAGCYPSWP